MITGKSGRLPYPVDVTCNHGKLNDLIPAFNFIVILNEFVFGFSEVSGIDKDIPYDEIREGGNPYPVFARKKSYAFEQLNFRKGLLIRKGEWSSDTMRAAASQAAIIPSNIARKAALIGAAAADPIASLENGPAYGFLQVFDRQYKTPLVSFSFFSHGASRWDITDLNATSGDFMYETVTLVCSDLKRLANSALPSGAWDSNNQEEHEYYEPIYEQIVEEMKKNNNEEQSEEKSKTDKSIDSEKQKSKLSQLDRKARLKKFIKDQKQIKLKRQEESEKLDKENAEVKDKQQKNKKDFEKEDKKSVDKLIEEIKQMDPNFNGESMSKADILKKLQELNNDKIKKGHQENKKKFEEKEKESVDKLIEEIKQMDPNFNGESMSKADILKKLQEVTNAKIEKEH